jgi:hypothetical protein
MQNLRDIVEALGKTLDINNRSVLNAVTSKLPIEPEAPQIDVMDDEMNDESEVDTNVVDEKNKVFKPN